MRPYEDSISLSQSQRPRSEEESIRLLTGLCAIFSGAPLDRLIHVAHPKEPLGPELHIRSKPRYSDGSELTSSCGKA